MQDKRSIGERLQEISDAGGKLEVVALTCNDLISAGYVISDPLGGGWGYTEEVTITPDGLKFIGRETYAMCDGEGDEYKKQPPWAALQKLRRLLRL